VEHDPGARRSTAVLLSSCDRHSTGLVAVIVEEQQPSDGTGPLNHFSTDHARMHPVLVGNHKPEGSIGIYDVDALGRRGDANETNKWRKPWYSLTMPRRPCSVSFIDPRGTEHCADVEASSLFEAATLGLEAFTASEFADDVGPATRLVVQVRSPVVKHIITVGNFAAGLNRQPSIRLNGYRKTGRRRSLPVARLSAGREHRIYRRRRKSAVTNLVHTAQFRHQTPVRRPQNRPFLTGTPVAPLNHVCSGKWRAP
jgi:hypothetical protein